MIRYPYNWYWNVADHASSGVFSSASGGYVPVTDATYSSWSASNRTPTIATESALMTELLSFGIVATTPLGLIAYAQQKQGTIAAGGISVNVAASGPAQMVEASTDPESLVLLQGAVSIAAVNPSQTFAWVPKNGSPLTLTATQINTIFAAVSAFIQLTFTTLAGVINAVNAGSVTTQAEVDTPPTSIGAWPVNS
jgi:hypothetical protein